MKIKKTQITVETYERLIIQSGSTRELPCAQCSATVQMLKPEDAASEIAASPRAIYRLVESGSLHFTECPDGSLLICANSLQKMFSAEKEIDHE